MKVNDHFHDFIFDWDSKFYFLVGGYGSSKSYHTAIKLVMKLVQEKRKALVVRQVFDTLRDTCFSLLCEVIERAGLESVCKVTSSPMRIKFSNGSEIVFKGCDKPEKLKSLNGISIVWLEESPEINYKAFKELLGRLRTKEKVHFLMSSNPVSEASWTFKHFFTDYKFDPEILYEKRIVVANDIYYHHSLVDDNYFTSDEYRATLEGYKLFDPDLYRIARLGRFGQLGVKVYTNMHLEPHEYVMDRVRNTNLRDRYDGIDFGFSVSYNAFVRCAIDRRDNTLFVYECFYNKNLINSEIVELLKPLKNTYHMLTADSARPELIEEINRNGIRCYKTKKGKGSVAEGIQKIKSFNRVVISEECKVVYDMMKSWTRKEDKDGNVCEDKFSFDNHFSDAIAYSIESYIATDLKRGKVSRGGI